MTKSFKKILSNALPIAVTVVVLIGFSAFHALRRCETILADELAPPPRFSTRFVLYPAEYIRGWDDLGLAPGWLVTYAPPNKTYGTAFFVSLFGKLKARGEPAIVAKNREQGQQSLEKFKAAFAKADSAVPVGCNYSNATAILGQPFSTSTNEDGVVFAHFSYTPAAMRQIRVGWVTNGFSLIVSNNVVIRKAYSYTSAP